MILLLLLLIGVCNCPGPRPALPFHGSGTTRPIRRLVRLPAAGFTNPKALAPVATQTFGDSVRQRPLDCARLGQLHPKGAANPAGPLTPPSAPAAQRLPRSKAYRRSRIQRKANRRRLPGAGPVSHPVVIAATFTTPNRTPNVRLNAEGANPKARVSRVGTPITHLPADRAPHSTDGITQTPRGHFADTLSGTTPDQARRNRRKDAAAARKQIAAITKVISPHCATTGPQTKRQHPQTD